MHSKRFSSKSNSPPLPNFQNINDFPNLVSPPIGAEAGASSCADPHDCARSCLPRCTSYSHSLVPEDNDASETHVRLYFASRSVEVWREYEAYTVVSLMSDVGGLMGLLLGLSIYSMVELGWRAGDRVLSWALGGCNGGGRESGGDDAGDVGLMARGMERRGKAQRW